VRIDSGVGEGDAITPHYDPMIAKLIVWGEDRAQALARMRQALRGFEVVGPATNVDFLGRLMHCRAFVEADLDTALIERERAALLPPARVPGLQTLAAAAAAVLALEDRDAAAAPAAMALDPWSRRDGWRLNGAYRRTLSFTRGGDTHKVSVEYATAGHTVRVGADATCLSGVGLRDARLSGLLGAQQLEGSAVLEGETLHLFGPDGHWQLGYAPPLAHAGEAPDETGGLTAPMPGKVIALLVAPGARVTRGQPLLVMEAMKMEHTIAAPSDGHVEHLLYRVGDQVAEGAALVAFVSA
jgi:3-methylcrotonyl-CoA carboxylase alpha subunit